MQFFPEIYGKFMQDIKDPSDRVFWQDKHFKTHANYQVPKFTKSHEVPKVIDEIIKDYLMDLTMVEHNQENMKIILNYFAHVIERFHYRDTTESSPPSANIVIFTENKQNQTEEYSTMCKRCGEYTGHCKSEGGQGLRQPDRNLPDCYCEEQCNMCKVWLSNELRHHEAWFTNNGRSYIGVLCDPCFLIWEREQN